MYMRNLLETLKLMQCPPSPRDAWRNQLSRPAAGQHNYNYRCSAPSSYSQRTADRAAATAHTTAIAAAAACAGAVCAAPLLGLEGCGTPPSLMFGAPLDREAEGVADAVPDELPAGKGGRGGEGV